MSVAVEAEVGGAAEGELVAGEEVAEEVAAEVEEAMPPQPPDPGLVFSAAILCHMAPCS